MNYVASVSWGIKPSTTSAERANRLCSWGLRLLIAIPPVIDAIILSSKGKLLAKSTDTFYVEL